MSSQSNLVCVSFDQTSHGVIPFTVSSGDQSVKLWACDSADPFPAMLRWLEAITTGVQFCALDVDEEGTDKQISIEQLPGQSWLTVKNLYDEAEVFLRAQVDAVQVVHAFYHGLAEYAGSPLYIKENWQRETLADRLASKSDPPRNEADIKASLLFMDRGELREALFVAAPAYDVKFPGIEDAEEREQRELFYMFAPAEAKKMKGSDVCPIPWDIRKDYDQLSVLEKSGYIDELLGKDLGGGSGCALGELRSGVIDVWLSERRL